MKSSLASRFCIWMINLYRRYLSGLKPPCCRFVPTCSQYAVQAFQLHGFWRGLMLTTWRILRCQPFYRGAAYDPVPPPKKR